MEKEKGRLWVHTASVGEFNTIKPLLKRLVEKYHIILTYFSFRAKEYLKAQRGFFHELYRLPIDLPPLVRRFEKSVKPDAILIMERELWPSLILFTKAPKVWLNAYAKESLLERLLSKRFKLILTRGEKDKDKFLSYGCKEVIACGNLKFLLEEPPEAFLRFSEGKLLVAGSTHEGEEELLKSIFLKLKADFPELKLVIAPRHISRAQKVAELFAGLKVSFKSAEEEGWQVLVVDTLGELFSLYRYASVTFVGGTFVPVGGHNLLEPAYFKKPVLFGPYTHKVKDLKDFLMEKGMGFEIRTEEEFYHLARKLLSGELALPDFDLKDHSQKVLHCYVHALGAFLEK